MSSMKRPSLISFCISTFIIWLVFAIFLTLYPQKDFQRHDFHALSDLHNRWFVKDTPYTFAMMDLPLNSEEVTKRFTNEMELQAKNLPQLLLYKKRSFLYLDYIKKELVAHGVPEDFAYIAIAESGLNPEAVSPAWAAWLRQFLPSTAGDFGLTIDAYTDQRLDLIASTEAAIQYFKNSYTVFNDWTLVAASFNRWITGIKTLLADQEKNSYYDLTMNQETGRYIFRIVALKYSLQSLSELYDFSTLKKRYSLHTTSVDTIDDLSSWAVSKNYDFDVIKKLNPWILADTLPEGEWTLIIPNSHSHLIF